MAESLPWLFPQGDEGQALIPSGIVSHGGGDQTVMQIRKIVTAAVFLFVGLGLISQSFAAGSTASGPAGLALAAVVAEHSPVLSGKERRVIARLFNHRLNFSFPSNKKISVTADAVVCRMSDVDIAERSCTLTFGKDQRALKGRLANELNATVTSAGVTSEVAAGTIFTSFKNLACTIDPDTIKQKAGGGADCTFVTGP